MALERDRTTIQPGRRIGHVQRSRLKPRGRCPHNPRRMTKLHLTPPVRQFLGHHPVPARPAVMKRPSLTVGVRRPPSGHDQPRKMLVPRPACAVFAEPRTGRPRNVVQLKLAAPPTRDVNHLVRMLRCRNDRSSQPMQMYGRVRFQHRPCCQNVGIRVQSEMRLIGQPVFRVAVVQHQGFVRYLFRCKAELWQQGHAFGAAHDQAGLSGECAHGFGADRQVGIFIQHPARHIQMMRRRQSHRVFICRQGRAPIDHFRQSLAPGCQNKSLATVVQPPTLHYFTAPKVSPAIKCFCIKKNISTGGNAATILPALIR